MEASTLHAHALRAFLFGYDRALPLRPHWRSSRTEAGVEMASLTFASVHDQRVPALLARAAGGRPASAVLVQHGGGDSKDERHILLTLRRLALAGFAALAIDAPDHGERAPSDQAPLDGAWRRLPYRQRDTRIQNVIDLRRAVDLLETELGGQVDVSYWGVSMGVSVGLPLLAVEARVGRACFLLGGASRRPLPDEVGSAERDLLRQAFDPVDLAPLASPRAVLMLNGTRDASVPPEAARELYEALLPPKEQRWYAAAHRLTAAMLRDSIAFLRDAKLDPLRA